MSRGQPDELHSYWPYQLKHPSTFNLFAVPSAHQCQHNCPWSTPAAWPTGWSGAGSIIQVQPRRQGRVFKIHTLSKKFFKGSRIIIYNHSEVLTEQYLYFCSWDPSFRAPVKHSGQLGFTEKGDARTFPFQGQGKLSSCTGAVHWLCYLLQSFT